MRVRVLYTINSSPQYILARSHSSLPVTPIPDPQQNDKDDNTRPKYATVSLKACLDTICRSSPELIQDNNRDYSVYVLDPLESNSAPAPMNISNSNNSKTKQVAERPLEQPCSVAVGLGLMSWALHENDGVVVTGTRVKMNTGQEALEVIFALRETAAMQRASLSSTMRSWGFPLGMSSHSIHSLMSTPSHTIDPNMLSLANPTMASSTSSETSSSEPRPHGEEFRPSSESLVTTRSRNRAKQRPKKVAKASTAPTTESDKLAYASETYIGPLKKKGRPKNSDASVRISKNSEMVGETYVGDVRTAEQSTEKTPVFQQENPQVASSAVLTNSSAQLLTSTVPSIEDSQSTQNQTSMLDLLTALSSYSTLNTQNAQVLSALSTIDTSDIGQQQSSEPNPALVEALRQLVQTVCARPPLQATNAPSSDPPVASHDAAMNASQDEDVVILDKENVDPMAFRRRAGRESKENDSTQSSTLNNAPADLTNSSHNIINQRSDGEAGSVSGTAVRRKRTLSDFMDEKELEKTKQREKEQSEKRESHHRRPQARTRKSSGSSSIYDASLRHYPRMSTEALPRPGVNYYRLPLEFRSSPPRPKTNTDNLFRSISLSSLPEPRAPASSPPRSGAGRPRRRYVVPQWARTSTATQPRLSEDAQRALEEAEEQKRKEKESRKKALGYKRPKQESRAELNAKQTCPQPSSDASKPNPPVAAGNSCPVFATSGISNDIFFLSQPPTESPHSPLPSCSTMPIPLTPPQKPAAALFTPDNGSSSLFTPTPKAKYSGRFPGSTGRSPFPPVNLLPQSPSPSAVRSKSTNMSPIQAVITGKSIGGASGWNGGTIEKDEYGWDESDAPPSSLPTASDTEDHTLTSGTFETDATEAESEPTDDIEGQGYSVKQHWLGLPPSSPPPPSSPTLTPQEQDDDDVELTDLPVPTSDFEEATPSSMDTPTADDDETEAIKDVFDFFISSLSSDGSIPSDMDISNHLPTGTNEHEDHGPLGPSLDALFQLGPDDFDITEFWESFKPLVEGRVNNAPSSDEVEAGLHSEFNLDHLGLAEDMRALYSGCLV